jgi:hypothetical protein
MRCLVLTVVLLAPQQQSQPSSQPASQPAAATVAAKVGPLSLKVPGEWRSIVPKSSMRKAQWALPGAAGASDADLTVFHFGPSAGTLQANLDRWKGQFEQAPPNNATTSSIERKGASPITVLEVSGKYVAEKSPGSGERYGEKDWRMLAAVVETADGSFYFKLVGPAATVQKWKDSFLKMF